MVRGISHRKGLELCVALVLAELEVGLDELRLYVSYKLGEITQSKVGEELGYCRAIVCKRFKEYDDVIIRSDNDWLREYFSGELL